MALESTAPVASVNPVGAPTPQASGRSHARRVADAAAAGLGASPFAQLLRGQREAADASAQALSKGASAEASKSASKEAGDDDLDAAPDDEDEHKEARKLPAKLALSAEDLPTDPAAAKAAAGGDLLNRLLGANRAQARQAALGAERNREARHGAGRAAGEDPDGAMANAVATGLAGNATSDLRGAAAASTALSTDTAPVAALQAAPQGAAAGGGEGLMPSLAAPGEVMTAPAAPPPPGASATPDAYATLAATPGSEAFPAALGAQLSTWASDGVEYARLELNPQELGPIEVHIALRDGSTRIELGSEVASTRAALNDALPQLAEALGDIGLALSGGQVSDQAGGDRSGQSDAQSQARQASSWLRGGQEGGAEAAATPLPRPVNPRALLDMYA